MSIMEKFAEKHNEAKALTVAAVLAVSSQLTACAGMTPHQAGRIAAPACGIAGGVVGAKAADSDDPIVKTAGVLLGGYLGQDACRAAAEAMQQQQGHCKERVVVVNGKPTITSNCERNTGYPDIPPQHGFD